MTWQNELKHNIKTLKELKKYIDISPEEEEKIEKLISEYPMEIPRYYLNLIKKDDIDDPIRKIAIPSLEEFDTSGSFDTSGEKDNTIMTGLQHKYDQTALILSTSTCFMYCRHCFRKRFVGTSSNEISNIFDRTIEYISKNKEINNVLITGGDSFSISTDIIKYFIERIYRFEHIDFIRFGTRIPVVFPQRIIEDPELIDVLKKHSNSGKRIYIVTQFNHPNELTKEARQALDLLIDANVMISNQAVLMRGVNDNSKVLADLLNKLVRYGVFPYYVFQCRPVKRVKNHFQIPLVEGCKIIEETKKYLNGHSKRFRYCMSHTTGKVEIIGIHQDNMIFKYHQAKDSENLGRIFMKKIDPIAGWLDDFDTNT